MPGGGWGPGQRPAGRTTWRPVLLPAHTGSSPGTLWGCGCACPVCSRVRGRRAAAFIPSGCPRLRGHGAVRVRAAGSIRPVGRPPVAGASKTSDHALPASVRAHAAFGELGARSRTWPSREPRAGRCTQKPSAARPAVRVRRSGPDNPREPG